MKTIITNDDGFDAPGLWVLEAILHALGPTVVVAPDQPQSGVAHRVTSPHTPIAVVAAGSERYRVAGTPADCVRIALKEIAPDADWVMAGINPGANLGSDVYNSGTVAAAREAAILGVAAMAVSQYISRDRAIEWDATAEHAAGVIHMLLGRRLEAGFFWNVNLPHPLLEGTLCQYQFCGLDTNPHGYTYRREPQGYLYQGTIHNRPRDAGRDVAVCFGGAASITRIAVGTCGFDADSA